MSVCELPDGRVLVHDFAGCDVEHVLSAVGLKFADLEPERVIADRVPRERRPFLPSDVFEIVRVEAGIVAVIAADMAKHRTLDRRAHDRLLQAVERLEEAARHAYTQ